METYDSLSLEEIARRCADSSDVKAWEELVRRMQRLIAKVAYRTAQRLGDASRQTVDDLIQETYLKLCDRNCRLLREFKPQHAGSLTGYVQVVTANVVRDHFKALHSKRRGDGATACLDESYDPAANEDAAGSAKDMERTVLFNEIDRHLEGCLVGPDRHRNRRVFWLYYRAGLSASAIAALPGIDLTTKGVESLVLRIAKQLRERVAGPNRGTMLIEQTTDKGIQPAESF